MVSKHKKMGRPKSANPRTRIVTVKFTAQEFREITKAATKKGIPIAVYIRRRTLR